VSYQQSAGSPTRGRFTAVIVALATLAAAAFAAVVPATAARADIGVSVYCEEFRFPPPDGRRFVVCWNIDDVYHGIRPPGPCLSCPWAILFRLSLVLPDPAAHLVAQGIFDGRHNLLRAILAGSPQERDAYRAAAWASYRSAAANLGQASLAVDDILIHYKDGAGDPDPEPNRSLFKQYGTETIRGLNLQRAALANPPNAGQFEQQARAAFDRAAAAFAQAIKTG
jgi:hypothetical protein